MIKTKAAPARHRPTKRVQELSPDATQIIAGLARIEALLQPKAITVNNTTLGAVSTSSGKSPLVKPRFSRAYPHLERIIVIDSHTGLHWTAEPIGTHSWKKAGEACAKLGAGWRLPSIEEIEGIRDRSRYEPAFPPEFKLPSSGWLWSSTKATLNPESYAWCVDLDHGGSGINHQSFAALVLAVRGPK